MELARHADRLRARGYEVCSISYDPVDVLREFADRRGITYPLLSDPDSAIIRAFGLFNEEIEPGTRDYGVPHPAMFFVDRAGRVIRKYMEERHYHRRTLATILADDGEPTGLQTVWRLPLALRIDPQPYLAVDEPVYPAPDGLWTSPLEEQVPVYTRGARIRVEVALGTRQELKPVYDAGGSLEVAGILSFQACSDTVCWSPRDVAVTWALTLLPPDLERFLKSSEGKA